MRMRQAGLRWQHGSMALDREARSHCLYSDTPICLSLYASEPTLPQPSHLTRLDGREIQKIRFRQKQTADPTLCWPLAFVPRMQGYFCLFLTITTVELNCGLDSQNAGISPKFSGRLLFLHLDGWGPIGRRRLNGHDHSSCPENLTLIENHFWDTIRESIRGPSPGSLGP
jgi:hypothetical protein